MIIIMALLFVVVFFLSNWFALLIVTESKTVDTMKYLFAMRGSRRGGGRGAGGPDP